MTCVAVYADRRFDRIAPAMNLALAATSGAGRRVLLWEFAAERSAAAPLGAPMRQYTQARRLFAREADMPDSIRSTGVSLLDILPAQATVEHLGEWPTRAAGQSPLASYLERWGRSYDLVIVDCPAQADADVGDEILEFADLVVAPLLLGARTEQDHQELILQVARCRGGEAPVLPVLVVPDADAELTRNLLEAVTHRLPATTISLRGRAGVSGTPARPLAEGGRARQAFASVWMAVEQKLAVAA